MTSDPQQRQAGSESVVRRLHRRLRATPAGRATVRVAVTVLGGGTILLGLVLVPLPGPGWLVVFAGLAILGLEYAWAKHLLRRTRFWVHRATSWLGRQAWPVRLTVSVAGLGVLAGLVWGSLRVGMGPEPLRAAWRILTSA